VWRGEGVELLVERKLGVDDRTGFLGAREQAGQTVIALRSDDDIYGRGAPDDFFALRLSDAAGDCDLEATAVALGRAFKRAHASELGINLIDCLLADMAGVEDHKIGFFSTFALIESLTLQQVRHTMRVVDVHLAAKRLDMNFADSVHVAGSDYRPCAWQSADTVIIFHYHDLSYLVRQQKEMARDFHYL